MLNFYEPHYWSNPNFPMLYHLCRLYDSSYTTYMHWHESIELLYVLEASPLVLTDTEKYVPKVSELCIINSETVHSLVYHNKYTAYHCLLVDPAYCQRFGIPLENVRFESIVQDEYAKQLYLKAVNYILSKEDNYIPKAKIEVFNLLLYLLENHAVKETLAPAYSQKLNLTKEVIKYIRAHFVKEISLDALAERLGFSKYYICREFKQATGQTIIQYTTNLRCNYALQLLQEKKYSITEIAEMCGFYDVSYFSKTFKKLFGYLPSQAFLQEDKQK